MSSYVKQAEICHRSHDLCWWKLRVWRHWMLAPHIGVDLKSHVVTPGLIRFTCTYKNLCMHLCIIVTTLYKNKIIYAEMMALGRDLPMCIVKISPYCRRHFKSLSFISVIVLKPNKNIACGIFINHVRIWERTCNLSRDVTTASEYRMVATFS